jgi:hypothetical protein
MHLKNRTKFSKKSIRFVELLSQPGAQLRHDAGPAVDEYRVELPNSTSVVAYYPTKRSLERRLRLAER